ncbi:hypothetical protein HCR15_06065 [Wolbachia pipientis]|uniref:hypothetical protein n=1 Tax=Wolbachia pipientis TaxID=955 RepID=UPI0015F8A2E0|nr:hypothetical protein [Wolbachia pipientis]MBA8756581.1 hypothetical protein [Wolbachia pipientis]
MNRNILQRKSLKSSPLENKLQPNPEELSGVCDSDWRERKDESENKNLEQESDVSNMIGFHTLGDKFGSLNSFCISTGTLDELEEQGLSWDGYLPSYPNESTDSGIVQETSTKNVSSPIFSEESFFTDENESEPYESPNNSIFMYLNSTKFDVNKDGIYTHDDPQHSESLISGSRTPGNSPRIPQAICFSARDTSKGEELIYKTSSYNPSQKNSKGKKIFLCLTVLSCTLFWGSLTSSFLGKPLISDQKSNLMLLAILGAAFAILGSIALVLYCYTQPKENKPLDALDQVSMYILKPTCYHHRFVQPFIEVQDVYAVKGYQHMKV